MVRLPPFHGHHAWEWRIHRMAYDGMAQHGCGIHTQKKTSGNIEAHSDENITWKWMAWSVGCLYSPLQTGGCPLHVSESKGRSIDVSPTVAANMSVTHAAGCSKTCHLNTVHTADGFEVPEHPPVSNIFKTTVKLETIVHPTSVCVKSQACTNSNQMLNPTPFLLIVSCCVVPVWEAQPQPETMPAFFSRTWQASCHQRSPDGHANTLVTTTSWSKGRSAGREQATSRMSPQRFIQILRSNLRAENRLPRNPPQKKENIQHRCFFTGCEHL